MIYSTLLAAGGPTAAVDTLVYTAPMLNVVVVRDIVLLVTAGGGTFLQSYGQVSGPGDRAWFYASPTVTARQAYQWTGRQVLRPGEQVYVHMDTGTCYYRITGYLLT